MKTTNTHNVQVNKNRDTVKKFHRFFRKVKIGLTRFVKKNKPVAVRFFTKTLPDAFPVASKLIKRAINLCASLIRGCMNLAVKLPIILIALLRLKKYIKANPEEWAHVVSFGNNMMESAQESYAEAIHNVKDTCTNLFDVLSDATPLVK